MQSSKRILLYSICISVLASCSSIQLQEGLTTERQRPKFLTYEPKILEESTDPNDHKIRKKNKSKATIAVYHAELLAYEMPQRQREFILEELYRSLTKEGYVIHEIPQDWKLGDDTYKKFIREKDIDGILSTRYTPKDNTIQLQVQLSDSVHLKDYGSVNYIWSLDNSNTDKMQKWEIQKNSQGLSLLESIPSNYPKTVQQPTSSDWKDLIDKSIYGTIQVFSSSSDTKVVLDGKSIGTTPIRKLSIVNGPHVIVYSKPGVENKSIYIHVRAGEDRNFYQEWEDDISTSTLKVTSIPQGLNVIFDGTLRGETNQYLSEIAPGDFEIQFTRNWEGEEIVFSEGSLSLDPREKKSITLPYFVEDAVQPQQAEFWTPSGRNGFNPSFKPLLNFKSTSSRLIPGDYGYYSAYFFNDRLEIAGSFMNPNSDPNAKINFVVEIGEDVFVYEVQNKLVSFYHFSGKTATTTSLGVWVFKKEDPELGRPFAISTNIEKGLVQFDLGNRQIYETPLPPKPLWRVGILTRGEAFYKGAPISKLKIVYNDLVKLQTKWDKK
jgi:hypothetical protein